MASSTLLVAVDFAEASMRALAYAEEIARPLDAEVVLVHVFEPPIFSYPEMSSELVSRMFSELSAAAKKSIGDLAKARGNLRSMLRQGDAPGQLLAAIEELKPAMVIMGTHGRRGLRRLLIGSVAEQVLRHSSVPVLTVRTSARD